MEILKSYSNKTYYFITINIKGNKFTRFNITWCNYFCKWLITFPDKVYLSITNRHISHRDISPFNSFIKHIHRSIKTRLNIILYIISSNTIFMNKTRVLSTRSSSIDRWLNITVKQWKSKVRCWQSCLIINA